MGDMADYFIEQAERYDGFWRFAPEPDLKTCDFCGQKGLTWGGDTNGYYLMEGNRKHVCFSKLKPVNLEDIIEIPTS